MIGREALSLFGDHEVATMRGAICCGSTPDSPLNLWPNAVLEYHRCPKKPWFTFTHGE